MCKLAHELWHFTVCSSACIINVQVSGEGWGGGGVHNLMQCSHKCVHMSMHTRTHKQTRHLCTCTLQQIHRQTYSRSFKWSVESTRAHACTGTCTRLGWVSGCLKGQGCLCGSCSRCADSLTGCQKLQH